MPDQKHHLAAIMFTDIVGYTTLMGVNSVKALELVRDSVEIQKPLVTKYNGTWIKEIGDGVMAKFSSAIDAVNCSMEIQNSAHDKLDAKLRIGIHLGDMIFKGQDVYGDGVNVASRLESIADPGGIYISDSIEKAIRGQTGIQAKYIGEIKLKNVDYEVRTYALQGVDLPVPDIKADKNLSGRLAAELQRRGVLRAGATYIIFSFLLILIIPYIKLLIDLPPWISSVLITVLIIGFPPALYLAWNFERSPEGFVRTNSKESWQNPFKASQRKPATGNFIITGLILIIAVMYLFPRPNINTEEESQPLGTDQSGDKSIAVLPFKNDSPDQDNQYFCDGMMDEILNHLQNIEELGVKSRTAVEPYRNSAQSFETIATELDVVYILEGAVRKYGENFRLTTQLIDVASGNHLWSETYDGVLSDTIFVIQSNIAKRVASSLNAVITPDVDQRIERFPTSSINAYDNYLKGRGEVAMFWKTRNRNHLKSAHGLFDKAIQMDPEFLQAITQKGLTFASEQKFDSALYYADRALTLDPESNHGFGLKGMIYSQMGNVDQSIANYLKAINLPPKDDLWYWYHTALGRMYYYGEKDIVKAIPYFEIGFKYTDNNTTSYAIWGHIFLDMGDYEKAEKYSRKYVESGHGDCFYTLALINYAFVAQGKFRQAIHFTDSICQYIECTKMCQVQLFRSSLLLNEFEQAEEYYQQFEKAGTEDDIIHYMNVHIGYVYYKLGRTEEAIKIFKEEIKKLKSELNKDWKIRERHELLCKIYAFLGDREEALYFLNELADIGFSNGFHDFILIDPFFESLWDDPEFKAIVKRAQDDKAALQAQVREMEELGEIDQ